MDCTLNLIDVRDVARGLSLVMERGQPGAATCWDTQTSRWSDFSVCSPS